MFMGTEDVSAKEPLGFVLIPSSVLSSGLLFRETLCASLMP